MEQHDSGRRQDPQIWNHGPERLLGRSSDHEETETHQANSTVRGVHSGRAYLHHHGTDETRILAGLLAGCVCLIILLQCYILRFRFTINTLVRKYIRFAVAILFDDLY